MTHKRLDFINDVGQQIAVCLYCKDDWEMLEACKKQHEMLAAQGYSLVDRKEYHTTWQEIDRMQTIRSWPSLFS